MAVPSPSTKPETRQRARDERKAYARALTSSLREELEAKLARIVLPHLIGARVVAGYHPMKDEISPYPILTALGPGQTAVLPWFGGRDERMIFRKMPATETGPWNMLQPPPEAEALAPDVVLVPLVYVDRHGTRIGQGKGHYDRALAHLREVGAIVTIGLAWEVQVGKTLLEPDPWDMPLDAVATPAEWISCR